MKKLLIVLLAFTLAGCSALAPVPPQPTSVPPPAQVVVQTVVVMITPTPLPPTAIPTVTIAPTTAPTQPPAPTQGAAAALPTAASASVGAPLTLPNTSGGGVFINMSVSSDYFSLRCYPKELTFTVTAADSHIVSVEFYYRIQDKNSVDISDWLNGGLMEPDKQGNFSFVLKAESINPDWRRAQTSYDFQVIGFNKTGDAVGRTERIIKLINYSNDCP